MKTRCVALTSVAQLAGLSHKQKGRQFHSQSGHITGVAGSVPDRGCTRGNWSMLPSHIDISLSLSFPSPLSKINK